MGHLAQVSITSHRTFLEAGDGSSHDAIRLRPHIFDSVQVGPTSRPIKELYFVPICEPSLEQLRLVDRRLISLEINYPIRINFSHCGDHDISQYVEILGHVEATIYLMEQSESERGDPSPNRYRSATRACRLFHIFCILTGPLRSIVC
jgi:hypothetical protein